MENWQSHRLKRFNLLFVRVRRKGDEVAHDENDDDDNDDDDNDNDDDDAVRTSVSQDGVMTALCSEELFSALSICSSSRLSDDQLCGGRIRTIDSAGPAGSHTSRTSLWDAEFPIRPSILYNYFVTGECDKAVFFYSQRYNKTNTVFTLQFTLTNIFFPVCRFFSIFINTF